ncbi:hypothetical protein UA08_02256 [Talaromyces atroroseus]|uniref:Uncharacterized protein n=1 Tax=Talaromyces atroroseus TaxID=1441469 RepID=A0A225AM05_TALAT|nr:hypothetical protein UA08_02256 [Talaromyces atroroseus]OKL61920.1 hypothetical protein UA08_02256 [Talaromyces atroroseus]
MTKSLGCVPGSVVGFGSLRCLPRRAVRDFSSRNGAKQCQALTWVARDPHSVTPKDIIAAYAHLRPPSEQSAVVPILFASPEFTPWIEPASPLLAEWATPLFNKIYPSNAPDVVHTVAAVVDRISTPRGKNNTLLGAEGISLLLADSSCVTASIAPPTRLRSSIAEEPSFFVEAKSAFKNGTDSQLSHEVGLRLAQTVFRNGRDKTLLGMRWTRDRSSNTYSLDECRELSTCFVTPLATKAHCSIKTPLYPVTQRRRVVSSMGNILRQVSKSAIGEDDMNTGIPASSELEKELPRYVSELGIPHQRVAVWALVEPSKTDLTTKARTRRDFQESILSGSKIHRVVSGGGGWGKKQGLLSLDPEITFEGQHRRPRSVSLGELFQAQTTNASLAEMSAYRDASEGKGLEENMASLSQVASPGDYIQFFVASDSLGSAEVVNQAAANLSYSFGVEAPLETETVGSSAAASRGEDVTIIPNHFGAISESAISYSHENISTKISVPGSRVELLVE